MYILIYTRHEKHRTSPRRLSALIYGTTILVNLRLDQIMMVPALAPSGPPAVTYSVVILGQEINHGARAILGIDYNSHACTPFTDMDITWHALAGSTEADLLCWK